MATGPWVNVEWFPRRYVFVTLFEEGEAGRMSVDQGSSFPLTKREWVHRLGMCISYWIRSLSLVPAQARRMAASGNMMQGEVSDFNDL